MIKAIENKLIEIAKERNIEFAGGAKFLKFYSGDPFRNKKVILFAFNEENPIFCIKTVRDKAFKSVLEEDSAQLKSVGIILEGSDLINSVPVIYYYGDVDEWPCLIESIKPGRRVSGLKHSDEKLLEVISWLEAFGRISYHNGDRQNITIVESVLKSVDQLVVGKDAAREIRVALLKLYEKRFADDILKEKFNVFIQHGDFHHDNILIDEHSVSVVDWSSYGKIFLPAFDLYMFLSECQIAEHQLSDITKNAVENLYRTYGLFAQHKEILLISYQAINSIRKYDSQEGESYFLFSAINKIKEIFKET